MTAAPMLGMAAHGDQMPGSGTLDQMLGAGVPVPPTGGPQPLDASAGAEMGGAPDESSSQEQNMNPGMPM